MPRLLFEKTGKAVYISHLDLMRLFQRAFKRAGLPLKHTQGFSPRPMVSIALPLSVGVESVCELLDFDLEGTAFDAEQLVTALNSALVSGVHVRSAYDNGMKLKHLSYLRCEVILEYDRGVPECADSKVAALFTQRSLTVEKHGKNGVVNQDIIPMIRSMEVSRTDNLLRLEAVICCQNPTLNPMQLAAAVCRYLPELTPDFSRCKRLEIYDQTENVFR